MESNTFDFDIFFTQEEDYGEKKKLICTLKVDKEDCVQNIKYKILSLLSPTLNQKNVSLKFYNTEARYSPGFGISGLHPEPPHVELTTNNNYPLKDVIEKIPNFEINESIKLKPIKPMRIVAYVR